MKKPLLKSFLAGFCALSLVLTPPLASFTAVALLSGCASVAPGHDPIVVRAEQTAGTAFDIIDGFLAYEKANRDALWKKSPDIKRTADKLRADAPGAIQALRSATKAYKENRTTENKASLTTWLAVVDRLILEAQKQLADANTPAPATP